MVVTRPARLSDRLLEAQNNLQNLRQVGRTTLPKQTQKDYSRRQRPTCPGASCWACACFWAVSASPIPLPHASSAPSCPRPVLFRRQRPACPAGGGVCWASFLTISVCSDSEMSVQVFVQESESDWARPRPSRVSESAPHADARLLHLPARDVRRQRPTAW